MPIQTFHQKLFSGLLLLVVLVGCAGQDNTPTADTIPTNAVNNTPEAPPLPPDNDAAPTNPVGNTPTVPGAYPPEDDAPLESLAELSDEEILAAEAGEAVYSGYSCIISAVGCTCETPVVQRASFEFLTQYGMVYRFSGSGFRSEWQMTRLGPNQWSYELAMYDNEGAFQGAFLVLMTFTGNGFILTQITDSGVETDQDGASDQDGLIICPDVYYRRLEADITP